LLNPLYIAVSWVLLRWHQLFATFLSSTGGLSWALSIAMLVITIRILLFRFTIKTVHNQRKMQEMQPKISALRDKYKNDRQTLSQEMMKLQKEEGFNPIAGCLPILLQAPIFISLFHVLRLVGTAKAHFLHDEYHWTNDEVSSAGAAKLFGAPIAAAFRTTGQFPGINATTTKIVAFVLILCMCAATYITQRQIMARSGQVLDGQQAMIQKLMLYGMPASLLVSGFLFPIGVLLYWFTNNLWTMGQQFYILKKMPPPGAKTTTAPSEAAKALAPRPGQKPVNAKRRTGTTTAAAAGSVDGDAPAAPAPAANGQAATPRPGQKPARPAKAAEPVKPAKAAEPVKPAKAAEPAKSAKTTKAAKPAADAADAMTTSDAAAADASETDSMAPSDFADPTSDTTGGGGDAAASGGGANRTRPANRPQNRRAPTTTRSKKKRR
jgi:YidC/Oxa1 family membrane protein insertase